MLGADSNILPGSPNYQAIIQSPCAAFPPPEVPGATVMSVSAAPVQVFSYQSPYGVDRIEARNFCDVNVTLTHGSVGDNVRVQVWLPLDAANWNGRYVSTGGGGFATGMFHDALIPSVNDGFVAAATDGGLTMDDGTEQATNDELMLNFASRSLHDMTVVGKAITKSFYGKAADYNYWSGCSTGGRQGMMMAQKYPEDFDGILANAPAINFGTFVLADLYPYVAMLQEGEMVEPCVFDALQAYNIEACDGDDGAKDGIISDPESCKFDAQSVVGKPTKCEQADLKTISARQAKIYNLIMEGGPVAKDGTKLWYPLDYGTKVTDLATDMANNAWFDIPRKWFADYVMGQPDFDIKTVTNDMLVDAMAKSLKKYEHIIETNNPDLSAFRDKGGKILSWHGLTDSVIMAGGTWDYKRKVDKHLGGAAAVNDFYRVFVAPGVDHCFGGAGPNPTGDMQALIDWVEKGVVPETLAAATVTKDNVTRERNLCLFPLKSRYRGEGDINKASSWECVEA